MRRHSIDHGDVLAHGGKLLGDTLDVQTAMHSFASRGRSSIEGERNRDFFERALMETLKAQKKIQMRLDENQKMMQQVERALALSKEIEKQLLECSRRQVKPEPTAAGSFRCEECGLAMDIVFQFCPVCGCPYCSISV
eukprot:TRINITY_DN11436_c0_g1_i1.p1 TRINITY_DN11436_c0_g1~~TRINITY_DN11436_c0_g1_i1.p1  ORF type:complete len:154 (+),score=25.62 TRINITY_DN11436_c0_g1_i1:51-464(+)